MDKQPLKWLVLGGALRLYLATSDWGAILANRIEIATPLNSFKRGRKTSVDITFSLLNFFSISVQEGIYLLKQGTNPYDGDMVHEIPLVLWFLVYASEYLKGLLPLLYVLADITTAGVLYKIAKLFVRNKLQQQIKELKLYAKDTEELQYQREDENNLAFLVLMAYLFNPLAIFNCAGLTSTVFSNLFLALALYGLVDYRVLLFFICIVIESHRNLYPIILLAPAALIFNKDKKIKRIVHVVIFFVMLTISLFLINYMLMGESWKFIDGSLGFM